MITGSWVRLSGSSRCRTIATVVAFAIGSPAAEGLRNHSLSAQDMSACDEKKAALIELESRAPNLRARLAVIAQEMNRLQNPSVADAGVQAALAQATIRRLRAEELEITRNLVRLSPSAPYYSESDPLYIKRDSVLALYGAAQSELDFWLLLQTDPILLGDMARRTGFFQIRSRNLEAERIRLEFEQTNIARRISLLRDQIESLGCGSARAAPGAPTGLARIVGSWVGTFKRDDNGTSGLLSTVFTVKDGQLGGWHYQNSWPLEDVSITGNTIRFSHQYGTDCRARHTFTIFDYDTRRAQSKYTVTCPGTGSHTGTINYSQ